MRGRRALIAALVAVVLGAAGVLPAIAKQGDAKKPKVDKTEAEAAAAVELPAPFTSVEAFAHKAGFRGVVTWSAEEPVQVVLHYGASPDALDQVVPVADAPDTAGLSYIDGLEVGSTYYVAIEDQLSGAITPPIELAAANAYNDLAPNTEQDASQASFKPNVYTIDLVVQLDSQAAPESGASDATLDDIARSVNVLAERVYDALDGHVRLGQVLITDTNVAGAGAVTGPPLHSPGTCETPQNLADILFTTAVPFSSQTFHYAIAEQCTPIYMGREGQLVVPWEGDLHMGATAAHEMMHYSIGAPDLYGTGDATGTGAGGCRNLDWDGSLMHNSGGWVGDRWELTELDTDPSLTPCGDHAGKPYSWDEAQSRYTAIPDRTVIEDMINKKPRGNADGGALDIRILDREPGASTLVAYEPDDSNPELGSDCVDGATSTSFDDPSGDATMLGVTDSGQSAINEPSLDILTSTVTFLADGDPAVTEADTLELTIAADDLSAPPTTSSSVFYEFHFTIGSSVHSAVVEKDAIAETFTVDGAAVSGTFDAEGDLITFAIPATMVELSAGDAVRAFEVWSRRTAGLAPLADTSVGGCPVTVPGGSEDPGTTPVGPDAVLTLDGDAHSWTGGPYVDAFGAGFLADGCDLAGGACEPELLELVVPATGATLTLDLAPDEGFDSGDLTVFRPDGQVLATRSFSGATSLELAVSTAGVYQVIIDPTTASGGSITTTAALVAGEGAPPVPPADFTFGKGGGFTADGESPADNVEHECTGPNDPLCVTYVLELTEGGTLSLEVTTPVPLEDYDLYLYDLAGTERGLVANPGTVIESGEVSGLLAGTYYLAVQPYIAHAGSTFTVSASLS